MYYICSHQLSQAAFDCSEIEQFLQQEQVVGKRHGHYLNHWMTWWRKKAGSMASDAWTQNVALYHVSSPMISIVDLHIDLAFSHLTSSGNLTTLRK